MQCLPQETVFIIHNIKVLDKKLTNIRRTDSHAEKRKHSFVKIAENMSFDKSLLCGMLLSAQIALECISR